MKNKEEYLEMDNKLEIFLNNELFSKYIEDSNDFHEAIEYLDTSDKVRAFKSKSFNRIKNKVDVICNLNDTKAKARLLADKDFCDYNGFSYDEKVEIIGSMKDESQIKLLSNTKYRELLELSSSSLKKIVANLGTKSMQNVLENPEIYQAMGIKITDVIPILTNECKDPEVKLHFLDTQNVAQVYVASLIKTLPDNIKIKVLLENRYPSLRKNDLVNIVLVNFSVNKFASFYKENKVWFDSNNISVLDVVRMYRKKEPQLEFVKKYMDVLDISDCEKRKIIAGLQNDTKAALPESIFNKYEDVAKMQLDDIYRNEANCITPNLDGDLSVYKDLDELLHISPIDDIKNDEQRKKFNELIDICPGLSITDEAKCWISTVSDYKEAEKWIDETISQINESWSTAEKMAYIHVAIGKRASYTPEYGTEVSIEEDLRPMWKVAATKKGICLGFANLEKYMFSKIGVDSQTIKSDNGDHAFVMAENVEIPTKDGVVIGNTLLDPTWDLANGRFNARLNHFCRGYKEMRESDFVNKVDEGCHKCRKLDALDFVEMDDSSLRKVCKTIGIVGENNRFLSYKMLDKIQEINDSCPDIDSNIMKKFDLLKETCPEFIECMRSSMKVMRNVIFKEKENFKYNRCVISRAYDNSDESKMPIMFTYFDLGDKGKRFYYADKDKNQFIGLSKEDFERRFSCYEEDMEDNIPLWEQVKEQEEKLAASSGTIKESEER